MIRLEGFILVLDAHSAIFGPDRDRPVCADSIIRPIELDIDIDRSVCRQCERLELMVTLREDTVVGVVRCLDHVVLASVIPEMVASGTHAALVPSSGRHVHNLLGIRLDCNCVPRAFCTAVVELSVRGGLIVKHEEVVRCPARGVVGEVSVGECGVEEGQRHKEYAIVVIRVSCIRLVLVADAVPFRSAVAPCSVVLLRCPWIAHLDKLNII